MRFYFRSAKLEALYTSEKGAKKYPPEVIDAFFELLDTIKAAPDERTFYELKSLHYEKLIGKRSKDNQRSLRLNDQWRLIVKIERDEAGNYVLVIDIEDYH